MAENTIPYSTVTGSFWQLLGDYDLSDMSPDIKRMSGTVVLTPSIKYVRVNGTLLELKPVQGRIVNGEVLDRLGNGPLIVFPTNAEISGIHGWYWKAKVSIPGARIPLIMFYAPAGGSVNLSDQAKGVSGASVEYIEGPSGPAGPPGEDGVGVVGAESTGYGKFALNLSDGTKSTEIVLPSPETPYQTAVRSGYVGTEAQWVASIGRQASGVDVEPVSTGIIRVTGPSVVEIGEGMASISFSGDSTTWSINPLAKNQGRWITTLYHDPETNAIYSGFGDWSANGDFVGVVKHDLGTGQAQVLYAPVPSEAIECVVRLSDGLYVPHTDGNGSYWDGCGYSTDAGGSWHDVTLPGQAIHVFDMCETSHGMYACGASITTDQEDGQAAIWYKPSGGEWVKLHTSDTVGAYSRYYRIEVEGDAAVTHGVDDIVRCVGDSVAVENVVDPWDYRPESTITVGNYVYTGLDNGRIVREDAVA